MKRRSMLFNCLAQTGVVLLGIIAVIGSGGGAVGFPEVDYKYDPGVLPPSVVVCRAGRSCRRAPPPHSRCWSCPRTDPSATSGIAAASTFPGPRRPKFTLNGVQISDDGAVFQVFISAGNGVATAGATLFVSPMPEIVFRDEEFPLANWTVSATPPTSAT